MKKILIILVVFLNTESFAQSNKKIGGGYFGHTVTHPGVVLEFELEYQQSEKISLPMRLDLGFYRHKRNHDGLFFDLKFGSRRYFKNGLFIEQSIGVGIIETIMNEDVFTVDNQGNVSKSSKFNQPDFMPSITLGLGYSFKNQKKSMNTLWIRPKIFWQVPYKMSGVFHPVLQVGLSHSL